MVGRSNPLRVSAEAIGTATACAVPLLIPSTLSAAPLNYLLGHGEKAYPVVALTWGVAIISITVIAIIALLVSGAVWYRPRLVFGTPGSVMEVSRPKSGTSWIWIGVGLSSLVLLFAILWTMRVLAQVTYPAKAAPFIVEVTGRQWWWQVRYLPYSTARVFTTANEIHIPTGTSVKFRLIGGDVIHSFWVPALTGKTDTIPGQTNETWLEARRPGAYRGQCTEYCGLQHAHMGLIVIAQTPRNFAAWWQHQLQPPARSDDGQVAAGQLDFNMHCGSCHTVRGTEAQGILGPDLSHLMTRRTIAAVTLPNTPENLEHWISDPQGVKPGALMQKPELNAHELQDILAYLKSLK